MRHQKHHSKLSRPTGHRNALLRNLAHALIMSKDGRIETTITKAKVLRSFVDQLVTLGKKGTLHHRRLAFSKAGNKEVVHRLFAEIAPLFAGRNGGYTRVVRTRQRAGDASEMALVEFVAWMEASAPASTEGTEAAANA